MYKTVIMIKRRKGMSMEEFINYYENQHAPLGIAKLKNMKRYIRHYIRPFGNEDYPADAEPAYDVLTEIWFEDEAEFRRGMAMLSEPETAAILQADEEKVFERSSIKFMIMEDHESKLGAGLVA